MVIRRISVKVLPTKIVSMIPTQGQTVVRRVHTTRQIVSIVVYMRVVLVSLNLCLTLLLRYIFPIFESSIL